MNEGIWEYDTVYCPYCNKYIWGRITIVDNTVLYFHRNKKVRHIWYDSVFSEYDHGLMMNLYLKGFSDYEMVEFSNSTIAQIRAWRKKYSLVKNPFHKRCEKCHSYFLVNTFSQKFCNYPSCDIDDKAFKYLKFKVIKAIRSKYHLLCETDPDAAKSLEDEMEIVEGKEFREMVLDGIYEKHSDETGG